MARTRFQPERERPEPRYGKGDLDQSIPVDPRANDDEAMPEYESVEDFVQYILDCERTSFTTAELVTLAAETGIYNPLLREMLEEYGLKLVGCKPERKFATFGTNQHDRWTCEESRRMNGGGGGDSLIGMVGRVG